MYGLRILLLFDNKELIERQAEVQRLVFPILIIMILLVVGCAYFYSRDLFCPCGVSCSKVQTGGDG